MTTVVHLVAAVDHAVTSIAQAAAAIAPADPSRARASAAGALCIRFGAHIRGRRCRGVRHGHIHAPWPPKRMP